MLTQGLIFLGKKSGILQGNRKKKKKVSFSAYYEIKKYYKVAYASFPQFSYFSSMCMYEKNYPRIYKRCTKLICDDKVSTSLLENGENNGEKY